MGARSGKLGGWQPAGVGEGDASLTLSYACLFLQWSTAEQRATTMVIPQPVAWACCHC